MSLYIWKGTGVLQDYGTGLIVALAWSLADALEAIQKEYPQFVGSFPPRPTEIVKIAHARQMKPRVWLQYGSA